MLLHSRLFVCLLFTGCSHTPA